jgi:hypothetical protein
MELMPSGSVHESSGISTIEQTDADWPTCWTLDQKNDFCRKYDCNLFVIKNVVVFLGKSW